MTFSNYFPSNQIISNMYWFSCCTFLLWLL